MTLTETLQLKERFLKYEDLRALDYCEKRWLEEKRPVKRWEMFNFIEKMLQELKANGIGYPKVLLLRKKEIQRGTFKLELCEERDGAREPHSPGGDDCPECQGRGFHPMPGGTATLCLACLGGGRKVAVAPITTERQPEAINAKYGAHP